MEIFYTGAGRLATRYEALGLKRLLPIDRVWVGVHSSRTGAFGGFHHPNQGYRHLQMGAIITRYGDLTGRATSSPELVALDLLRSYAHDCLHYGTCRRYRLEGRNVHRVQYGVNFRRVDGRTYSCPDPPGGLSTRNLGIVMEGATDREARAIARETSQTIPHLVRVASNPMTAPRCWPHGRWRGAFAMSGTAQHDGPHRVDEGREPFPQLAPGRTVPSVEVRTRRPVCPKVWTARRLSPVTVCETSGSAEG